MVWWDMSWVPGFFTHESLDVRQPMPMEIVNGFRVPSSGETVIGVVGTFHPVTGENAEKDSDDGQHVKGDGSVYTTAEIPLSDNELEASEPGARLYHHDRVYEFVHREPWREGAYFRYVVRLRTNYTDDPGGNGGGG